MASLHANIAQNLKSEVANLVKLGLFKNESEVIQTALKKMFAEHSREYLRELVKQLKISRNEMLKEGTKIRK